MLLNPSKDNEIIVSTFMLSVLIKWHLIWLACMCCLALHMHAAMCANLYAELSFIVGREWHSLITILQLFYNEIKRTNFFAQGHHNVWINRFSRVQFSVHVHVLASRSSPHYIWN